MAWLAGVKGLEPLTPGFGVWDRLFCPVMSRAEVSIKSALPPLRPLPRCCLVAACLISLAGNWPETYRPFIASICRVPCAPVDAAPPGAWAWDHPAAQSRHRVPQAHPAGA